MCDIPGCKKRNRVKVYVDDALEARLCYAHGSEACASLELRFPLRTKMSPWEWRELKVRARREKRAYLLKLLKYMRKNGLQV